MKLHPIITNIYTGQADVHVPVYTLGSNPVVLIVNEQGGKAMCF